MNIQSSPDNSNLQEESEKGQVISSGKEGGVQQWRVILLRKLRKVEIGRLELSKVLSYLSILLVL